MAGCQGLRKVIHKVFLLQRSVTARYQHLVLILDILDYDSSSLTSIACMDVEEGEMPPLTVADMSWYPCSF